MSKPIKCKGSFRLGTACATPECTRCTAAEYTPEKQKAAKAAEAERTKDLPASRVKPKK